MKKSTRTLIAVIVVIALIVGIIFLVDGLGIKGSAKEITWQELKDKAISKEIAIEKIETSGYEAYIYLKNESKPAYYMYISTRGSIDALIYGGNGSFGLNEELVKEGIEPINIYFDDPNAGQIWIQLAPIFVMILIGVLFFFIIRQQMKGAGGAMGFAKSKARTNENIKVRFNDVAGAEEEKEELKEIVDFLKNPRKFSEIGARIPKGVLLVGPPGTGKTLFAKAVAGEANVPFFSISGSDFVEMFVGVGASRVRDMFEMAKKSMPCIVFIDEIDAVGRQRGAGLGGGNDEREQTLNQLLVQMDGFETNDGIIIMAATNRADVLDPALLRPGRFDRQIYVHVPDVRGREDIFKVHARNKPIASDVNFKSLARMTSGFTGADIENLLNEAAILAARKNNRVITMDDISEGINKVIMGPKKKSRIVTESDKRITAYHEAGHAILAHELEHSDPVYEVSIIPRGWASGYTMIRPDDDNQHETKQELLDTICVFLGGRVAEELVIKDICTGAVNDLQRSSELARKMVTEWGMSDVIGPVFVGGSQEVFLGRDYQTHTTYSENVSSKVDAEINKIMSEAHARATKVIQKNINVLNAMARLLIEEETIYSDEIEMLFQGKTIEEITAFIKGKSKKAEKEVQPNSESPKLEQNIFVKEGDSNDSKDSDDKKGKDKENYNKDEKGSW